MKLTTVTAALAVTLALAPSAHARGYHVRAAFNHRQSVYHQGVFRHGGYQYAGQRSDQGIGHKRRLTIFTVEILDRRKFRNYSSFNK